MSLNPDDYRIKVGNYGERWYHDPLPSCPIAAQDLDWRAPAVSTIKKASSKDWTQVALGRAARWVKDHNPSFLESTREDVYDALSQANSNDLDRASTRGIQIHRMFEVYAEGGDPASVELSVEAQDYQQTVLRCIRTIKPLITASEFICMSRSVGYGGTADAIWDCHFGPFDGLYLVDYKSRGENQAVYIEEAWQVAAYAKADYVIEQPVDTPVRARLPLLSGGIILSITPESYEFYPVDIEAAWPGFLTLRRHWQHRADGKSHLFGKPWSPQPSRDEWIRDRIESIKAVNLKSLTVNWPAGVPFPKKIDVYTDEMIDQLIGPVEFAETELHIGFPPQDPAHPHLRPHEKARMETWMDPEEPPDTVIEQPIHKDSVKRPAEGSLLEAALPLISHRWSLLHGPQQQWINAIVLQAHDADMPIRVAESPTQRRVAIAKALIRAAEEHFSEADVVGCVAVATQLEVAAVEYMNNLGMAIGMMGFNEAETFLALVKMVHSSTTGTQPDNPDHDVRPKGENMALDAKGNTVLTDKVSPKPKAVPATAAKPRKPRKKAATP